MSFARIVVTASKIVHPSASYPVKPSVALGGWGLRAFGVAKLPRRLMAL
jgi:hypothetical protein